MATESLSKHMAWVVPAVAIILSVAASFGANSFREGTYEARVNTIESELKRIQTTMAKGQDRDQILIQSISDVGGKLDLFTQELSYVRRDITDLKTASQKMQNDYQELKIYVLTNNGANNGKNNVLR